MRTKLFFILALCLTAAGVLRAQKPAPAQSKSILLKGGIAHIGNGKVIQNSLVGFKNGKLVLVADAAEKPDVSGFEVVTDISGKHVYPGFIVPSSTIGLTELEAVRATNDLNEVGYINSHVRSVISYNTDSKIIPTVRTNGVLLAQVTPRGGLISGSSSIMELDGWNWEDAVFKTDDGIHLNWPGVPGPRGPGEPEQAYRDRIKNYNASLFNLTAFFRDAKAYSEIPHEEKNLRMEAMQGVMKGNAILYIHTNYSKDISDAIAFAKKAGIKKYVLVGARDAWMLTDLLKENNVPVVLARVHELPERTDEDVDLPYKRAAQLFKAGILVCLTNEGDMEAMGARNLPFQAGTTVAYGLTKEEALMLITSNTAKIMGVSDQLGTLEAGKQATLFVSTGDALDMITNKVEKAYIDGKETDLFNEQEGLYKKYKEKYGIR